MRDLDISAHTPAAGTRRVAVITGGGSGIGAATAAEFADRGYAVVICGRRAAQLDRVAHVTGARPYVVDLMDAGASEAFITDVVDSFGRIDALVLNAGTTREAHFEALTDEDWSTTLAVNLQSAARLARAALPALAGARGSIVGVASIAALRASSVMAAYSASKAGLVAMIQSIAVEYADRGVRANAVCPGWVRTEMADEELAPMIVQDGITLDEAYERITALIPARRAAHPAEIARVIAFLASDDASYVTGAALPVDGGTTIADLGALAL